MIRTGPRLAIDGGAARVRSRDFNACHSTIFFMERTRDGLVIDKTAVSWPASIAATGLALAAYPVAVERGFMPRAAAAERTLTTLRFFWNSPQRSRTRRHRPPGLLLSFSRHENRSAHLAMRVVDS